MVIRTEKPIRQVAISQFKAKCLALLDDVNKTKTPLRVTRHGKAIAEVIPPAVESEVTNWMDLMSGDLEIIGDVISPVIEIGQIEALKQ